MPYRSTINYFLFSFRVAFILLCIFFIGGVLNIFPFLYQKSTPFIGKLLLGISSGVGLCWGIIITSRALYFRTKIISIVEKDIKIQYLFGKREKNYMVKDIKKIITGTDYDMGNYSNGIKIEFKNGDKYTFIWYDYLNLSKLVQHLSELKKVDEVGYL